MLVKYTRTHLMYRTLCFGEIYEANECENDKDWIRIKGSEYEKKYFTVIPDLEYLKDYILDNYNPETPTLFNNEDWDGYSLDGIYSLGFNQGSNYMLYEIGLLIGLKLEEPKEL